MGKIASRKTHWYQYESYRAKSTFEHAQTVGIHIILHMCSLIQAFALHWNIL